MKIMLEKAPKTLTRLSDPGPIEKSPLCNDNDVKDMNLDFTKNS